MNAPASRTRPLELSARVLVLLGALALAYLPVWRAGFLWDDDVLITDNVLVGDPAGLAAIWTGEGQHDYFPLTQTLHWVEYRLWGANALGYHLVNLALHAAGALVLWRVLVALAVPGAWLAALVFAVHPVGVASVAWVSESKNTLSLLLAAAAMLAWLRFDTRRSASAWALSLLLFGAALLAKTSVVGLPLVFLLGTWGRGRVPGRRELLAVVPHLALGVALGFVTVSFQSDQSLGALAVRPEGWISRLAVAGMAPWFYLGKCLMPVGLSAVYPRWDVTGTAVQLLPGLAWLGLLVTAWRRRAGWGRAVLVALLSGTLLIGPVLGLVTMSHHALAFVADHFQYPFLACVVALVVGGAVARWPPTRRRAGAALAGVLVVVLVATTATRAAVYVDLETLSRDVLADQPDSWFAHNNLGAALLARGAPDEALPHLRAAADLNADYAEPRANLGYVLTTRGDHAEAERWLREAVALQPASAVAWRNLADALATTGRPAEARAAAERARVLLPADHRALLILGRCALMEGDARGAEGLFRQAVERAPDTPAAHNSLGVALASQGRVEDAAAAFDAALARDPEHAEALNNLGRLALQSGDRATAAALFRRALAARPGYEQARANLAEAER